MRDAATFTVDDPRFSTGQVVGQSMLTRDGAEHDRHRDPFARAFRLGPVQERFSAFVAAETDRLLDAIEADRARGAPAEPRRAARRRRRRLCARPRGCRRRVGARLVRRDRRRGHPGDGGRRGSRPRQRAPSRRCARRSSRCSTRDPSRSLLAAAAGDAAGLERRRGRVERRRADVRRDRDDRGHDRERAPAPALRPGGARAELEREPELLVERRRGVAAARARRRGGRPLRDPRRLARRRARSAARELVTVSIAGANRDPETFPDPDRFDIRRDNARLHLAFAQGPHVCIGMHLARLEAHTALGRLLERFPRIRLDPAQPSAPRGLVFRKPPALHVLLDGG